MGLVKVGLSRYCTVNVAALTTCRSLRYVRLRDLRWKCDFLPDLRVTLASRHSRRCLCRKLPERFIPPGLLRQGVLALRWRLRYMPAIAELLIICCSFDLPDLPARPTDPEGREM